MHFFKQNPFRKQFSRFEVAGVTQILQRTMVKSQEVIIAGKYKLERIIGGGSYGNVYAGKNIINGT